MQNLFKRFQSPETLSPGARAGTPPAVPGVDGNGANQPDAAGSPPGVTNRAFDPDIETGAEPSAEAGVHAITKATDYWFERRAHALEQRAASDAAEWARAGLPLQDVEYKEPLDVEVVLASHARQT